MRIANLAVVLASAFICADCSSRATPEVFACGEQQCEVKTHYCQVEHFSAATADRCTCKPLPRPKCGDTANSGKCSGSEDTGLILELFYQ
jgi:hypothetical protein